jgi:hypothetical protein
MNEISIHGDDQINIHVPGYGIVKVKTLKNVIIEGLKTALDALHKEDYTKLNYLLGDKGNGVLPVMITALEEYYRKGKGITQYSPDKRITNISEERKDNINMKTSDLKTLIKEITKQIIKEASYKVNKNGSYACQKTSQPQQTIQQDPEVVDEASYKVQDKPSAKTQPDNEPQKTQHQCPSCNDENVVMKPTKEMMETYINEMWTAWNEDVNEMTPPEDSANISEKVDKWMQKAINPDHKGYCTPMTKPTCTPQRKALANRFKKGDLSK